MKRTLSIAFAATLSVAAFAQSGVPAFPGAEGHGRYVTGGRGGKVIHVTNLNDKGEGSLRAAVSGSEKKIVVFDVGGVIPLESALKIGANTTIAGQTAPQPGITVRYYTVQPNGNNIIIRFLRFRHGEEKSVDDGADAIWARHFTGMVLDHCSMSWSLDETASFYDNNNFTMQWCLLGEGLNAGHTKGEHSYGGIWGGKLASFHHNMLLHMKNRLPRFNGARYQWSGYTNNYLYKDGTYAWETPTQSEIVDYRNCVTYNYTGGCYGGPGGGYINMVNNYFKAGPVKPGNNQVTQVTVGASGNAKGYPKAFGMTSRYYINGNYMNTNSIKEANYDWKGVKYDGGTYTIDGEKWSLDTLNLYGDAEIHKNNSNGQPCIRIKMDEPVIAGDVTTHSAEEAFNKVLEFSGASLYRDDVDKRYAKEAEEGSYTYTGSVHGYKGIIDIVADQGTYSLDSIARETGFDTDGDGIPDAWEKANGLDPNNADDAALFTIDSEKQYYSNLEVYLNSLVQDIMIAENKDAENSVEEYFPAYTKEDGTKVTAINGGNTGLASVAADGDVIDTTYYNLQGMKVEKPSKGGVYVKVSKNANGNINNKKIIKK